MAIGGFGSFQGEDSSKLNSYFGLLDFTPVYQNLMPRSLKTIINAGALQCFSGILTTKILLWARLYIAP